MSFSIRADFRGGVEATIFLKGSLVSLEHIDILSSRILNLQNRGARVFKIDISGLEYLNSSGVGAFVREFKRLTSAGLGISFVNPRTEVRNIFENLSLLPLLDGKDPVSFKYESPAGVEIKNPVSDPDEERS